MRLRIVALGIACAALTGILLGGPTHAQSPNAGPFQPPPSPTLFTFPIVDLSGFIGFNTFNLYAAYTAGLVDSHNPVGARVDFYLFDQATGLPMQSQTATDICNPCSFILGTTDNPGAAPRMITFHLGLRVLEAGGLASGKRGFAQVLIDGDAANVKVQGESALRFQEAYPVR